MIEYRPFRNTDPPQLAEIWRSQLPSRGLMQPMSVTVLERYVLSKPYFDRQGLIVAVDGGKLLGFAHAGFGPSRDMSTLSTENGTTCLVMLRPDAESSIAAHLLAATENYLRSRGARALYGGGCYPLSPFYYGLYGGAEFSGVLDSDARMQAFFREAGYHEAKRTTVLRRDLSCFRPVVDRQQMQIRRQMNVETISDAPAKNWWAACMFEPFDRNRGLLTSRSGGEPAASVYFWNIETMTGAWGAHAVGVVDLEVTDPRRRQGMAKYLLGEAFRQLYPQGVTVSEVHVAADNTPGLATFRSLGFEPVDSAALYQKTNNSGEIVVPAV